MTIRKIMSLYSGWNSSNQNKGGKMETGNKVKVDFDGVIVSDHDVLDGDGRCWLIRSDNTGKTHALYKSAGNENDDAKGGNKIDFRVIAPKSWPPQLGDVWLAGGKHYFCRSGLLGGDGTSEHDLRMCGPVQGDYYYFKGFLERYPHALMLLRQEKK